MNKKENSGYQRTHQAIEQALLALLREKDFSAVTVRDICERSGVHRSTFYAHFQDIYAVMEELNAQMEQDVIRRFEASTDADAGIRTQEYLQAILEHIWDNRDFYRVYLSQGWHDDLERGFRRLREGIAAPVYQRFQISQEHGEYYFNFFISGTLTVVRLWLDRNEPESPQELCQLLLSMRPAGADAAFRML